MAWLFGILGVLVAGYAGLCVFYAIFQERFIFIRFRTKRGHRYAFPALHGEEFISTADGAELHALHFKAEAPRGVILYFHGNTGSVRRWGKFAQRFVRLGYDVVMPDPRGYGKSRGKLSEAALHADAELWYAFVLQQWPEAKVVVLGRSLGSGLATPLAAKHKPRKLKRLYDRRDAILAKVRSLYLKTGTVSKVLTSRKVAKRSSSAGLRNRAK